MDHPPLSDLLNEGSKGLTSELTFLSGCGEMGALIRAKDWSKTSLGPIESWPHSLRTTVSICLASDLPICIIWGAGLVQIYNDGYRVICGEKHPVRLMTKEAAVEELYDAIQGAVRSGQWTVERSLPASL